MTIKEVCDKYHIAPDTLRYYERVGAIPSVTRTGKGIRNYMEQDISWVENAICMRGAGVPVEMIGEYVKLSKRGPETFPARCDLLKEVRRKILEQIEKSQQELQRLEYKIERYETAVKTGKLIWDREFSFDPETGCITCLSEQTTDGENREE